jgi:hypothetical protein
VFLDAFRVYKKGTTPPTAPGGGGGGDPTTILEPAAGEVLVMGSTITLKGEGTNLRWSYDANSDKLPSIDIDNGNEVSFTIPTGVEPPREITITCSGDNGTVERTYDLTNEGTAVSPSTKAAIARSGSRAALSYYGLDGRRLGELGTTGQKQPKPGSCIMIDGEGLGIVVVDPEPR